MRTFLSRSLRSPRRSVLWSTALILLGVACATGQDVVAVRESALSAADAGDHERAAERFAHLSTLEPDNPTWRVRAGRSLGSVGRYNDALDLLDEARRDFPNNTAILTTLAKTFHLKADSQLAEGEFDLNVQFHYEDVIRTSEQVLARDPTQLEARLLAASGRFQLGRLDEALADAGRATTDHPEDYGAQAMLGRVSLQQFIDAKRALQRDQPRGTVRREQKAALKPMRVLAHSALERATKADPKRSFPHIKLGDLEAWDGNMGAALPHYLAGLSLDPESVVDHEWLRSAVDPVQLAQLYRDANTNYRAGPDANPARAGILEWYGARSRFDQQDWQGSSRGFQAALATRPDLVSSYQFLMLAAYERGDDVTAAGHALTFARTAPRQFADRLRGDDSTKAILRGMAQRSFDASRLIECRELNHVLALATDTVDDWNNYALLCRETGNYEASFAAYQRALELEQSPQLLNDAAVILQYHLATKENLETAREFYERAIERANWMLVNETMPADVSARTRVALRDARANLRRLGQ